MLAPGVTIKSALLAQASPTRPTTPNEPSTTDNKKDPTNGEMKDASRDRPSSSIVTNRPQKRQAQTLDNNNNECSKETLQNYLVIDEDEEMPLSTNAAGHKTEEIEEFKKFYTLLNSYQQNPNFMSMIAAAANEAAANAAMAASSSTLPASNPNTALHNESLIKQQQASSSHVKKFQHLNKPSESNKKKKSEGINDSSSEIENKLAECHTKAHTKLRPNYRHHAKRESHQTKSTTSKSPNGIQPATSTDSTQQLIQSYSSGSSIASYSSSSISSDSNSSFSSGEFSPPPVANTNNKSAQQKTVKENLTENHESFASNKVQSLGAKAPKTEFNNHNQIALVNSSLEKSKCQNYTLSQSMSVPFKKPIQSVTNLNAEDFCLRSNLSHINIKKSSENINNMPQQQKMAQFIPPSLAALNSLNNSNNSLHAPQTGASATSIAVKLKLKNAILQKQGRNKLAQSNSNILHDANKQHQQSTINVTRSQNYLLETNYFKKSFQTNMLHHSGLNHINENNIAGHHYPQKFTEIIKERLTQQQQGMMTMKSPMESKKLPKHIEIQNELDVNNLRRTTSEPNLKVKSALKDRLLEKRNLQNPFHAKRPTKQHMLNSQQTLMSPPPQPNTNQQLLQHQKNVSFSNSSLQGENQMSKPLMPAMSLSSIQQTEFEKARQNEQVLRALAQAAAFSGEQKQHIAASALLSLSHSQHDLNEANTLAATLRHFQNQQDQQNLNKTNQNFVDQLSVASALLNQQQQNNYNRAYFSQKPQKELASSMSYPMLPNHMMMNVLEMQNKLDQSEGTLQQQPKFGYPVHVEEENEMLLENELKNAAKLNTNAHSEMMSCEKSVGDGSSNDENDMMKIFNKNEHDWARRVGVSTSSANIRRQYGRFDDRHPHFRDNQFYRHKLKQSHSKVSSMDQAKQLILLQCQQELEEHSKRQHEYEISQLSYFSDPYLIRSLESACLNSQPKLNEVNTNKKFRRDTLVHHENNNSPPPTSSITSTQENCSLNQSDDRIYRYTTGIVYHTAMLKHECTCHNPSNHLETADRIKAIWNRFKARDLVDECELVTTKMASISDLLLTHNEQYALIFGTDIETRPKLPKEYLQSYIMNICLASCKGFALTYDQDNSWNEEHTPLACRVAIGSTYEMARLVTTGKLKNGFALVRPPGSHAEFNKPLGFCYFNTIAIVAKMLKKNLMLDRILIVDWDVHHGNGTQQMTYNDPDVCYISLHRHDNGNFFPGTGAIDECGTEAGLGKNVNIAFNGNLSPPMSDAEYLAAFRCVVMPIAKAFKPQIVLVSCGFDSTENHPRELGGYKVSPMCFGYMTKKLMSLADGKVVLALEGGYDKQSLCDCSEICLNALTNKQIPAFPNQTLNSMPNRAAIEDLKNIIKIQKQYWPNLNDSKRFIEMTQNQFISINTE